MLCPPNALQSTQQCCQTLKATLHAYILAFTILIHWRAYVRKQTKWALQHDENSQPKCMHVCPCPTNNPSAAAAVTFVEINRKMRNKTVCETKHRATRPPQMWWFSNNYSLLSKGQRKINGFLLTCFAQRNWKEKEIHLLSERQRRETLLQKPNFHVAFGVESKRYPFSLGMWLFHFSF